MGPAADRGGGKRNTTGARAELYTGDVIRLGYPTQNLTIQAGTNRTLRLASLVDAGRVKGRQDPAKQAGAHAYSVDSRDWQALLGAIGGREGDVMVETKCKEHALAPMGVEIV